MVETRARVDGERCSHQSSRGPALVRPGGGGNGKERAKLIDILEVGSKASFWVSVNSLKYGLVMAQQML